MTKTMYAPILSLGVVLSAVACQRSPSAVSSPSGPAPVQAPAKKPAAPTATNPTPDNASPLTPVITVTDIPLGPVFPPARARIRSVERPGGLWGFVRRSQRWFKDAVPAGQPHHFTRTEDDPDAQVIKRDQDPEALRPALDAVSPHRAVISQILNRTSENEVTRRLDAYLSAENPKAASSAAELVISDIFAGDRDARTKLTELGLDFDSIKALGYYDEAIAGRYEYLQARADETYRRDRFSVHLAEAFFVVGIPALTALARFARNETALSRAVDTTGASVANLGQRAGHAWDRSIVAAPVLVAEKLRPLGFGHLYTGKLSRLGMVKALGRPGLRVDFTKTADPNFKFLEVDHWHGLPIPDGKKIFVIELKQFGLTKRVATNQIGGDELVRFRAALGSIKSPTVPVVNLTGEVTDTTLPEAMIEETARRTLEKAAGPQAFRKGQTDAKLVDEAADVKYDVATAPGGPRRIHRTAGMIGAFGGGALIGLPYYVGRYVGTEEGIQFNSLHFGGQLDENVRSPDAAKAPALTN